MIRFLGIQHLAVIDAVELELEPGLNVLTGETGAGKSIIVEALGLLLGGRASADLVRTGEETATIQAIFETPDGRDVIVRREISAQGRSRAFIDDALATSAALKELGTRLVDLHGQHEHQALLDPRSHLDLLDEFGGLAGLRATVGEAFERLRTLRAELERARAQKRDRYARQELAAYQLAEIDRAAPRAGEDEELSATRQVLANADRLQRLCAESYEALYDGDDAVLARLGGVWKRVADLAALDPQFKGHLEARDAIKSQLEDLAYALRSYAGGIDVSPARLQEVENRLALLERLKKKYGPALADVIARQASLREELAALETATERATTLEGQVDRARAAYLEAAQALSCDRQAHARTLARRLERLLAELAMERTRCEMRLAPEGLPEPEWTDRGTDAAEFYISPNPGEDLRPLAKIVSGGELSRIMLALKTLASTDAPGKTLVFDEVDAGIGGRVADVVGSRLRHLGGRFQVVCVTHLPQIAAYATAQYHVSKGVRGNRTVTRVARLDADARADEIARMMAGAEVSERIRASARELLAAGSADEGKAKVESESARAKGKRVG